jgi:hypothetical protein
MPLLLIRTKRGHTSELECDAILSIDGVPFLQPTPIPDKLVELETRIIALEQWASSPLPPETGTPVQPTD